MQAKLNLTNCCLLDKDSQTAKFQFRLQNYSKLKEHLISKIFHFGGHQWKLQVSRKHGYFGMFLRWCGTRRDKGNMPSLDVSCSVSTIFAVVNIFFPRNSIIEGSHNEQDVFKKVSGGIGFGKMVDLNRLFESPGYVVSDCIYLHLQLNILGTFYLDQLSCGLTDTNGAIFGKEFWFYGTTWKLLFFPYGEKETNRDIENTETEQNDAKMSSIYLLRCGPKSLGRLRHNVKYRLSVAGQKDIVLDQHFYYKESNAYGTTNFIPVDMIETMTSLDVTITFEHVVPYIYFAFKPNDIDSSDNDSFLFEDQFEYPWSFHLTSHTSNSTKACLTLDPRRENKAVASMNRKRKLLHVSWLAELLSPVNIDKSVLFETKSERQVNESIFHWDKMKNSIMFPIGFSQLFSGDSLLKDVDGLLCIRLSIYTCVFVTEDDKKYVTLGFNDLSSMCDVIRRSVTPPPPQIIEVQFKAPSRKPVRHSEPVNEEQDVLINSLVEHLDSSYDYIDKLESNPSKAKAIHKTTSIASLIQSSRPSDEKYKHIALMAKTLEDIFYTIPIDVEKVLHSGALGQETVVANELALDFVIYMKDYKKESFRVKALLNVIMGKIKDHASRDCSDKFINRTNKRYKLPFPLHFYNSSNFLLFKLGGISVSVFLSEGFTGYKSKGEVYKKAARMKKHGMHHYVVMMSYLQVAFVEQQPIRCKELICVVKSWSNDVIWTNVESRPGSYLLTLLVIHAYQTIEKMKISKTPSFDREVLKQFHRDVSKSDLHIEWNIHYNSDNYILNGCYGQPLVRDPAMPYHNVAQTGLKYWTQLRHEVELWIASITF